MISLVFATRNPNKVKEIQALLPDNFSIISLDDIQCREEIPETRPTIEGNALQKAEYVNQHYQVDCFSEDSGLEADALNGAPGVFSARFAGPQKNDGDNMNLLLQKLEGNPNRSARFKTVIALILDGKTYTFEGIINGRINDQKSGEQGFGYDPLFIPEGEDRTFAQMSMHEKNAISHRGKAMKKFIAFLQNYRPDQD